jgi:hypothetical protein
MFMAGKTMFGYRTDGLSVALAILILPAINN